MLKVRFEDQVIMAKGRAVLLKVFRNSSREMYHPKHVLVFGI